MNKIAIFGPPGTGKTHRLVKLIKDEIDFGDRSAVFLSFTKSAAKEAVSRLGDGHRVRASTIHALAYGVLGVNRESVVDDKKRADFGAKTGWQFKGDIKGDEELQMGDLFLSAYSMTNNTGMPLMEAFERQGAPGPRHDFERFCKEYAQWKETYGYLDFDDMLHGFLRTPDPAWGTVIIDEAQDCTNLQWACIQKLARNADNIIIAGDDDQAIYEWNGANPHGMVDFANHHGLEQQVLNQSYRVPLAVHELAHDKVLNNISMRVPKEFKYAERQGRVRRYGDLNGFPLQQFDEAGGGMILVRDRFQMKELRQALHHEMIPYEVIGGGSPWTSRTAIALRNGDPAKIHPAWIEFYRQWDPTADVKITIGTIHQAKGMEADRVVVDLTLSARTLLGIELNRDAELRVQYVAITRAAKELYLCGSNPLI